jgi:hypothetical protein
MPDTVLCTYGQGLGSAADSLFYRADAWARANWSSTLGPIYTVQMNPCLRRDCPCVTRFLQGTGLTNGAAIDNLNTFFAFHGTTFDSVQNICCQGWYPSKRRNNAPTYGEYFGLACTVSHGFCKGSNRMIVALIARNSCVTESPGSHAIVLNPKCDTAPCYCLPIAVVSFGCQQGMTWRH